MKNKLFMVVVLLCSLCLPGIGAAEKQVSIKGLTIGMPADEARGVLAKQLAGDWKITEAGPVDAVLADLHLENRTIFGTRFSKMDLGYKNNYMDSIIGDYGFAVSRNKSCEGFVSLDKATGRVVRISFGGEITEALYNPDKKDKINMEDFVPDFAKHFGLPEFNWIPHGWQYESPNGYTIMFKTDKVIDVKMNDKHQPPVEQAKGDTPSKFKFE